MLIHDRSSSWWRTILGSAGRRVSLDEGRTYTSTTLCLEAAARGEGVTIAYEVTSRGYLESGRLVLPYRMRWPSPETYFLVLPPTDTGNPTIDAFVSWLFLEAKSHNRWFTEFWD